MKLVLKRIARKENYTIGKLYIDGVYFCDTIEDKDRGLSDSMSTQEILQKKIAGITAIPTGTYDVSLDVISPKYSKIQFYKESADGGKVPRILGVKGYVGILIHSGNTASDTEGCIIVGENKIVGQVVNSKAAFKKLYEKLYTTRKKHDTIKITIE